jgi:hypothetical protein
VRRLTQVDGEVLAVSTSITALSDPFIGLGARLGKEENMITEVEF